MKTKAVIAAASVLIAASGCAAPTTVPVPLVRVVAQRYVTLEALHQAAVSNGFVCDHWIVTDPGRGTCGPENTVMRFIEWSNDSTVAYQANFAAKKAPAVSILWGPGWVVVSPDYAMIIKVSAGMGGTIAHFA